MRTRHITAIALLLSLTGCGEQTQTSGTDAPTATKIGAEVRHAIDEANIELATQNIAIDDAVVTFDGHKIGHHADAPHAEITPLGGLLIDRKPVVLSPPQQALLKDYRNQLLGIAEAGITIGGQGAELGINAATEALKDAFSGRSDRIEQHVDAQVAKIQAAVGQLCERLPALRTAQQQLAVALPAFAPYATLEQRDVDECAQDIDDNARQAMTDPKRTKR